MKQMKVRSKLLQSFSALIAFSIVISLSGIHGINTVERYSRTESEITTALNHGQNMQAGSLRYIIYGSHNYIMEMENELAYVTEIRS